MTHIIEQLSSKGIKTTPLEIRQFQEPKPGDPVLFPAGSPYPFGPVGSFSGESINAESYGRIAGIEEDGTISICCGGASVFLNDNGNVSISGGPFAGVTHNQLDFTHQLKTVRFWNWGDNSAGAHQGVDYFIQRPVWRLTLEG